MNLTRIIPLSSITEFKTGDIIQTTSVVPFVRHYAIVFHRNGVPYVADNSYTEGKIRIFSLAEYEKEQDIVGLIRTDSTERITDELIEKKIIEHSPKGYLFFKFNCENFIRDICGCKFGLDQRIVFIGIIPSIIIISGVAGYFIFRNTKIGGVAGSILMIIIIIISGIIGQKIVKYNRDKCPNGGIRLYSNNSCTIS